MYDLVIAGGRVIDPSQGKDGVADVAVADGRVVQVGRNLARKGAKRVIDVKGKVVTPGLIDLHCHVFNGFGKFSSYVPDQAGVLSGVTTAVDAGTTGASTFKSLREFVMPHAKTRIVPFLHVVPAGLAVIPELNREEDIQEDWALQVLEENSGVIRGVKIRFTGPYVRAVGAKAAKRARSIARQAKVPLMVHIGEQFEKNAPVHTRAMLPVLEAGDILTHFATGRNGGVMLNAKRPYPELLEARKRGVILDIGHGGNNLSFDVARRLMDAGVQPDTISTDMAGGNRMVCVFGLPDTLGKFLALGMSLPDVVRCATLNPAKALGMDREIGTLRAGAAADIAVFDVLNGHFEFQDAEGKKLHGDQAVIPVLTVRAGEVLSADWGPRPTGWVPPRVAPCC